VSKVKDNRKKTGRCFITTYVFRSRQTDKQSIFIQGVSGGIVNILGGGSMDYEYFE